MSTKMIILSRIAKNAKATSVLGASQKDLQTIWSETHTDVRSPYTSYGNPPMWEILRFDNGLSLYTRPALIQGKVIPNTRITMVEGVSYQFMKDDEWRGQAYIASFDEFERIGAVTDGVRHLLGEIQVQPNQN